MKKVFIYLVIILLMIGLFPKFINLNKTEVITSAEIFEDYDYGQYDKIRLLHNATGEVEELDLDMYLYGVVAAEMPVIFEMEALKAQSMVARTYTIYQIKNSKKHENADLCDSSLCCQAWISKEDRFARWDEDKQVDNWNKILKAVNDTKGKIIFYNGEPIDAFFHSNSGGTTELASNVWSVNFPYLQVVETSGEEAYSSYESEVELSKKELSKIMHEKYLNFDINFKEDDAVRIEELTESRKS